MEILKNLGFGGLSPYNPDVVIREAKNNFAGFPSEDGDPAFDVWTKSYLDELLERNRHESLTDEQREEILNHIQRD